MAPGSASILKSPGLSTSANQALVAFGRALLEPIPGLSEAASLRTRQDDLNIMENHLANHIQTMRRILEEEQSTIKYPVLTLPPEIVSQIFEHCLPTSRQPRARSYEAPLSLTHICHRWRKIAHRTPALWSTL
ncbi:hypothetical protein DFH09DRAFT_899670, partial [Mycena vulgaris]